MQKGFKIIDCVSIKSFDGEFKLNNSLKSYLRDNYEILFNCNIDSFNNFKSWSLTDVFTVFSLLNY